MIVRASDNRSIICPNCNHEIPLTYGNSFTIRSPADVFNNLKDMGLLDREELHVLLLNAKNMVTDRHVVYMGNVSAALVRVAEVIKPAVMANSAGMIIVHNHPSGDVNPSPDDLHLTAEIKAAAKLMNIDLLDHIIIARDSFLSLRDRGISFDRSII